MSLVYIEVVYSYYSSESHSHIPKRKFVGTAS